MDDIRFFNYIVIDTNAFDAKKNDFCGVSDSILPFFFKKLADKKIVGLSHPVLKGETLKHINKLRTENEVTKEEISKLIKTLTQNKDIFSLTSIKLDDVLSELEDVDIEKINRDNEECIDNNIAQFYAYMDTFTMLPYGDPASVFKKYFKCEPPFASSGNKKNEFPDAFVIESVINFIVAHQEENFIIVSNDKDWKNAFIDIPNIMMVDTINAAIHLIDKHDELVSDVLCDIKSLSDEIKSQIIRQIEREAIYLNDYDLESDVEIENIEVPSFLNNPITLFASNDEVLLQTEADVTIDGCASIIDQSNFDMYIPIIDMRFKNAKGKINCEIRVERDSDNTLWLKELQIIVPDGISLDVDRNRQNVQFQQRNVELEAQSEMFDALEDYYNH